MANYAGSAVGPDLYPGTPGAISGGANEVESYAGLHPVNAGVLTDLGLGFGDAAPGGGAVAPTVLIIQRQYDGTAGWVQYSSETFDPNPAPTATEPNHTNNLVASSHAIIGEA